MVEAVFRCEEPSPAFFTAAKSAWCPQRSGILGDSGVPPEASCAGQCPAGPAWEEAAPRAVPAQAISQSSPTTGRATTSPATRIASAFGKIRVRTFIRLSRAILANYGAPGAIRTRDRLLCKE